MRRRGRPPSPLDQLLRLPNQPLVARIVSQRIIQRIQLQIAEPEEAGPGQHHADLADRVVVPVRDHVGAQEEPVSDRGARGVILVVVEADRFLRMIDPPLQVTRKPA